MIPFLDLKAVNRPHLNAVSEAVLKQITGGNYILNETLEQFEAQFAEYCGARHCIGAANGSQAIELILRAWNFPPGSEIILPANTYIATVLPVIHLGLTPVFVEPDPGTYLINYQHIEAVVTPKSRAILAVHLYGKCCDMDVIHSIAGRYHLKVLTDAAQAHGATYKGKKAGNLAEAEAFSFYPTKNLGAMGDAGAVLTNDDTLAEKIRILRNYGFQQKNRALLPGINSRLDPVQAAVLSAKLSGLDRENELRKAIVCQYFEKITTPDLTLPSYEDRTRDCWHLFVIRHPKRDELKHFLLQNGVETAIHYPVPPHKQPVLSHLKLSFPLTEKLSGEILSLPLNSSLRQHDVDRIIDTLNKFK